MRAKDRGIDVRLIADKTMPRGGNSPWTRWRRRANLDRPRRAGCARQDNGNRRRPYADGLMYWTCGAAANAHGLNLVLSSEVVAAYAAHWRQRLTMSVSFDRREDWCRVWPRADRR